MELLQDQEKGHASFMAVSEFLLTHPVLSFGVQDVSHARLRHTEVLPPDEESESMTTGSLSLSFHCFLSLYRNVSATVNRIQRSYNYVMLR